jgi:hypothetical protein
MHEGIMDFLFDSGQHFQESWEMQVSSPEDAMKRLNRIAQARLGLLASSVRIVRLRVKGQPMQRKSWKGIAGSFAWPRHVLLCGTMDGRPRSDCEECRTRSSIRTRSRRVAATC